VLLRGPSGAGKSDLALRLIESGAVLVADDQVDLSDIDGVLFASPPPTIAGLIEIRNIGLRRLRHLARAPIMLAVDLVPARTIERLPEEQDEVILGVRVPVIQLDPFEISAAAKLLAVLRREPVVSISQLERVVEQTAPAGEDSLKDGRRNRLLLITGMSGAGRSSALKLLEDMGYEAVDNLPVSLLARLTLANGAQPQGLAVGIDIRTRDFAAEKLLLEVERLVAANDVDCRLVFLDCDDDVLARRYTETRRRHPLSGDRTVMDGIRLERELLLSLRSRADLVIDTSSLRTADLKRLLAGHFGLAQGGGLSVFVTSFSFREGLPRDADLVFDVRFLENPYYDPALRPLTGLDSRVAAAVANDPAWPSFFETLTALLRILVPRYDREGKSYLTIAVGCTGGRHRSVFVAERLGEWLASIGQSVSVSHRDVDKPMTFHPVTPVPRTGDSNYVL
jgi:RNase adaptor protein for sRNA GlmZ degradation